MRNLIRTIALALAAALLAACSDMGGESKRASVSVRLPLERLASRSSAREVGKDGIVYKATVTLDIDGGESSQTEIGTEAQIAAKVFAFNTVPVGATVTASCKVYHYFEREEGHFQEEGREEYPLFEGKSEPVTIRSGINSIEILVGNPAFTGIRMEHSVIRIGAGEASQIPYVAEPFYATEEITWSFESDNPDVSITFNSGGWVTAGETAGKATVTARTASGAKASCDVYISASDALTQDEFRAYCEAFEIGYANITEFEIPYGYTSIGGTEVVAAPDPVFENCANLQKVTIPESVIAINDNAFGCRDQGKEDETALREINIPASVRSIGANAFAGCGNLVTVTFAEGIALESIGTNAFKVCKSLASIEIPENVTTIGYGAFYGCTSLAEITFAGNSLASIDNEVFCECPFESIALPASLTSIGRNAFAICEKLETVEFAEGSLLESIGEYAFSYCEALASVTIPANVTTIENGTFYGCTSLAKVAFAGNSLTSIGDEAFKNCPFGSITLPSSLGSIGSNAFDACSLERITIPASVTTIGIMAFANCAALETVIIEDAQAQITISNYAFYSCTSLKDVLIFNQTPPSLGNTDVFPTNNSDFKFYVLGQMYISGSYTDWEPFNTAGKIDSLEEFSLSIFQKLVPASERAAITEYAIPEGFLYIGYVVGGSFPPNSDTLPFAGCPNLRSVTIPSTVKTIRNYSFYNCTDITSIRFEDATGWGTTEENPNSGNPTTSVSVADPATNAANLTSGSWNSLWLSKE